jgi:hypothetical protein
MSALTRRFGRHFVAPSAGGSFNVTSNDPTDHALAVIASIFEKPARPEPKVTVDNAQGPSSAARPEPEGEDAESRESAAAEDMHADDANDAELQSATVQEGEAPEIAVDGVILEALGAGTTAVQIAKTEIVEITVTQTADAAPITLREDGTEDLDALTRYGPGPLDALRFKWSVRHEGDGYYVDETIGTSSQPITSGPFSRADAIAFIDGRDRRTRRRFERLRNEIVSGPSERGVEDDEDETL